MRCLICLTLATLTLSCTSAGGGKPGGASGPVPTDLRPRLCRSLPFDLAAVSNRKAVDEVPEPARGLLATNGFVVVGPAHGDMPNCYFEREGLPVIPLVTVDSVVEVFLHDFEIAWCRVEAIQGERLAGLQAALWEALVGRWAQIPEGKARTAASRLLGLIAVGRSLGTDGWAPPEKLTAGVDAAAFRDAWKADLDAVLAGRGLSPSVLWERTLDWSIFLPVGPYAAKPELARCYRLSQWWGAQGLRAAEPRERLMAAILAWAMAWPDPADRPVALPARPELAAERLGLSPQGLPDVMPARVPAPAPVAEPASPAARLDEIEKVYDLFLGKSDNVPLAKVAAWLREAGRAGIKLPADFGTGQFDTFLAAKFAREPLPRVFSEWAPRDALDPERQQGQGVRLVPPRVTSETEVFARVTESNGRLLPRALDALAAWGGDRARELTLEMEPAARRSWLSARLAEARRAESRTARASAGGEGVQERARRLYVAMASPPVEDPRVPLFMRTGAYRDRGLAAAMATWAGLREIDSPRRLAICRFGGGGELPGVAEPNLEAWARLIDLWRAAGRATAAAGVALSEPRMAEAFGAIAEKQLRGQAVSSGDRQQFALHGANLFTALNTIRLDDGAHGRDRRVCVAFARSFVPDAVRWAGKACCPVYAVVEYGGKLYLCRGGVFDYREFDLPPGRALTREDFRKLMDSPEAPPAPAWTKSYRVEAPVPKAEE